MQPIKLKAVDFFSGAGGLTYGLTKAGIDVIAGIDNDPTCRRTFEYNNPPAIFLEKDIAKSSPRALQQDLRIERFDDSLVFAGCAPCQFWSLIQTSRERSRKSKDLIWEFKKFVGYFMPGFVVMENVPGISYKKNSPVGNFIDALEGLGYKVAHDVIDMALYGIPQKRQRFTLLASRVADIELPKPKGKTRTVRNVLGTKNGFPRINAGTRDKTGFMHSSAELSDKNLRRLSLTKKDGGDRKTWQNKKGLELPCYIRNPGSFYDTYGRMWWNKPAPTITTRFFSISNGRFAHPNENRGISLREGATLQTFPKKYRFIGDSQGAIAKMIGNAVPPKFAKILGNQILLSIRTT